jgi:hypothetical protein
MAIAIGSDDAPDSPVWFAMSLIVGAVFAVAPPVDGGADRVLHEVHVRAADAAGVN